MKATEILNKRIEGNSLWYGYANHEIVDFEIAKKRRDSSLLWRHFNEEAHIYDLTFSIDQIERMLNGEKVIVRCGEEVTEYSLTNGGAIPLNNN